METEVNDKEVLYFKVSLDDIYVEILAEFMNEIFNIFTDRGRTLTKSNKQEWTLNLDYGDSYVLSSKEEVEVFKKNQEKYLKLIEHEA